MRFTDKTMRRGAGHLIIWIRFDSSSLVLLSQSPRPFIQCRFLLRALSLVIDAINDRTEAIWQCPGWDGTDTAMMNTVGRSQYGGCSDVD